MSPQSPAEGESGERANFTLADYIDKLRRFPRLSTELEAETARQMKEGAAAFARIRAHEAATADGDSEQDVLDAETLTGSLRLAQVGSEAKDRLIEANLHLVVSIAARHSGQGLTMLDLIQEGNVGLMRSADRYDAKKGFRFSTYASWWIGQAITSAIADQAAARREPDDPEDPEGGSRVREPRRPTPSSDSGALELTRE